MASKSCGKKKPGLMMRLFSTERKSSLMPPVDDESTDNPGTPASVADEKLRQRRQRLQRLHSMDAATFRDRSACLDSLELTSPTSPSLPPLSPSSPSSPLSSSSSSPSHPKTSPSSKSTRRPSSAKSTHQHVTSSSSSLPTSPSQTSPSTRKQSFTTNEDKSASSPNTNRPSLFPSVRRQQSTTAVTSAGVSGDKRRKSLKKFQSLPNDSTSNIKTPSPSSPTSQPFTVAVASSSSSRVAKTAGGKKTRKKAKKQDTNLDAPKIDTSQPLQFPTTPEVVLDYHRQKPFLNANEEWLIVELNEFECLIDGIEILRIIAKHSKFFEVEPDQLWEEFFEFVEDVPSYDEIVNYDVWQEFRDNKYPC